MKKYKYSISVIIPIHNTEKYLEDAILSVVNQTMDFKKNIQLILINDGSSDNSEEICLKYKSIYPNNIIYKYQTNSGVSSARNLGLKFIEGEYVNFLDSDDEWDINSFKLVYNTFSKFKNVRIISARMRRFENTNKYHALDYKYKRTRVVNILKDFSFVQLSSCQCFFSRELLHEVNFDKKLLYSEDLKLVNEILLKEKEYIVLSEAIYFYRSRIQNDSAINQSYNNNEWYVDTVKNVYVYLFEKSKENYGIVLPYIQNVVMYDLQWRLNAFSQNAVTDEELVEYQKIIYSLLNQIDSKVIKQQRYISNADKLYLQKIKNKYPDYLLDNDAIDSISLLNQFANIPLKISNISIENNSIYILGKFSIPFDISDIAFTLLDVSTNKKVNFKVKKTTSNIFKYGKKENLYNYNIELNTPVGYGSRYCVCVQFGEYMFKLTLLFGKFAKINKKLKNHYYVKNNIMLKTSHNQILIINPKLTRIIINEVRNIMDIIKLGYYKTVLYRLLGFVTRPFAKNVWLISDRINIAGDNGEAFYNYILNNKQQELKAKKIKPYFIIDKKSDDYLRLKNKKYNVVNYQSFKHKLLFLTSPYIISAHADDYVINAFHSRWHYLSNFYDYKYIFLQHGIIKDDLSNWLSKHNKNIDKFVVSTKDEYKSILKYNYLYTEKNVILTGLPRYDLLEEPSNFPNKTILLAPTWRLNLASKLNTKDNGLRAYNSQFINSDFYNNINSLINNEKLLKLLKENNIELRVLLHPNFSVQISDFVTEGNVKIIEKPDYKKELNSNSLLVTDYSSLFFDFCYNKKPVIYFQFDKDTFFENHTYDQGYFSYDKDGFGDILLSVNDVVDKIEYYIKKDFKMEKKYLDRIDKTFAYTDKNNSKRVWDEVMKIYEEKKD